jgi:hypothetical protein
MPSSVRATKTPARVAWIHPALAAVLVAACGGGGSAPASLPPVPVEGPARDLRSLTGNWAGEFVSDGGGRRGSIAFSLQGGRDTAHAQVVFSGPTPPPGCTDPVSRATESRAAGEIVLTLSRVNVSGPSIGGWLRPYPDPELGCPVDTWFEGTIRGDTLDGMYFSHPADASASLRRGTWWAARMR